MPVAVQWLLSVVLLAGIVVWIIFGNTATGSIGTDDCELDSWLVPVAGGVIAYITAYGFFGTPLAEVIKGMVPLILAGGFAALFAWRGALLPPAREWRPRARASRGASAARTAPCARACRGRWRSRRRC